MKHLFLNTAFLLITFTAGALCFWWYYLATDPVSIFQKHLEKITIEESGGENANVEEAVALLQRKINDKGITCKIEISDTISHVYRTGYGSGRQDAYSAIWGIGDIFNCRPVIIDDHTVVFVSK